MKKIKKYWLARFFDFLLNEFRGPEKVKQKLMDYRLDSVQPNETIKGRAENLKLNSEHIESRDSQYRKAKDKFKRKQNFFF